MRLGKIKEIVAFMKQNPTFEIGIEGFADPRVRTPHYRALSERRVVAIRDALVVQEPRPPRFAPEPRERRIELR